ncbi:MAG TPA: hypothetical protein VFN64_00055, partial [Burkholderiaceae bacterium]|nr:hypothetical protein [Burkholderiaceae bacterium]
AKQIEPVEVGMWAGPFRSGYGLHLVLVREREAGGMPDLAALRPIALREVLAERRKRQVNAMYDGLLRKYTVITERTPSAKGEPAVPSKAPGGS